MLFYVVIQLKLITHCMTNRPPAPIVGVNKKKNLAIVGKGESLNTENLDLSWKLYCNIMHVPE